MLGYKEIADIIFKAKNIAIFSHKNQDADACASMFGLKFICQKCGKNAEVFLKPNNENYLNFLFPLNEAKEDFVADDFDLVVFVDTHNLFRVHSKFHDELIKCKNIISIDHHKVDGDDLEFENNLIDKDASCSQMIFELSKVMNVQITKKVAEELYAGLVADTNKFLNSNTTKKEFEVAIQLLDKGIDIQKIYDYLFRYKTKEQIDVNKFLLNNMRFIENETAVYIIFTIKDMEKLNAEIDDVKTFCNELVNIKGIKLSIMCIEYSENHYKISLRSTNGVNTFKFSQKMGGGGHIPASGFEIDITKSGIEKNISKWAKEILYG